MMFCFRLLRFIVLVSLVLSLGLFVAAGILDSWWTATDSTGTEIKVGKKTAIPYYFLKL